ncbi:KdsC family phosphatase [Nocardioides cavernaquae]|uniref:HAD-IIIA family hydrolase n=1 Tax=Nocardioides cavernaquae TaxID=2321396 RepID=A0A3A5H436_9ACTN|nr:HAD-IIIA family hydrolase [Nocardioides cavernaquae]RJS45402.1 HAD-IIIA family hydrolase [Nocardioides cavernaquae]
MQPYAGSVRLVIFDVDGVLTDGSIHVDGTGEVLKSFNVRDGLAIALLRAHGIRSGVLSGKSSPALDFRVKQLGFDIAITGRLAKREAYEEIKAQEGLSDAEIAYVGDDVVDLPLAGKVGFFFAPVDAHPLVLGRADYVLTAAGGRGAGREAAERVLLAGGLTIEEAYAPLIEDWDRFDAVQ